MNIHNQQLTDQTIEIGDAEQFSVIANSSLERCKIITSVSALGISLDGSALVDCEFVAKKQLKGMSWATTSLRKVKFLGRYIENEFGSISEEVGRTTSSCDFTAAHLDGCMFYKCDLSTMLFPKWPFFVVKHPVQNSGMMAGKAPNGNLETLCESFELLDPRVTAAVYYLPSVQKLISVEEQVLREFLGGFEDAIIEA